MKLGENESFEVSFTEMEIFALGGRGSCAFVSSWNDREQTDLFPGVGSQLFLTGRRGEIQAFQAFLGVPCV